MPTHSVKLIVNPNADLGRAWRTVADLRPVVEELGGADWTGTVYPTHAIELAQKAAEDGYELVITVGGDGTVHEVVNGLMRVPKERRPRLGIVPLGSGNDFAHSVGMAKDAEDALRQIMRGSPGAWIFAACRTTAGGLNTGTTRWASDLTRPLRCAHAGCRS